MRSLLLLLLALPLVACPAIIANNDDDDSAVSSEPLSATFTSLDFTHTFGVTSCTQVIGTVTFVNNTDTDATWTVSSDHSAVEAENDNQVAIETGTVAAGATEVIDIAFNCSQCIAAGFDATVTAGLTNGSLTISEMQDLTATFVDCP
jgi:hypothetical protein